MPNGVPGWAASSPDAVAAEGRQDGQQAFSLFAPIAGTDAMDAMMLGRGTAPGSLAAAQARRVEPVPRRSLAGAAACGGRSSTPLLVPSSSTGALRGLKSPATAPPLVPRTMAAFPSGPGAASLHMAPSQWFTASASRERSTGARVMAPAALEPQRLDFCRADCAHSPPRGRTPLPTAAWTPPGCQPGASWQAVSTTAAGMPAVALQAAPGGRPACTTPRVGSGPGGIAPALRLQVAGGAGAGSFLPQQRGRPSAAGMVRADSCGQLLHRMPSRAATPRAVTPPRSAAVLRSVTPVPVVVSPVSGHPAPAQCWQWQPGVEAAAAWPQPPEALRRPDERSVTPRRSLTPRPQAVAVQVQSLPAGGGGQWAGYATPPLAPPPAYAPVLTSAHAGPARRSSLTPAACAEASMNLPEWAQLHVGPP